MVYITGNTGYERIYGTSQNDTIDGKGGNDLIFDYYNSNDTYIFNYGYGQPTFTDAGGNDTILFGPGIKGEEMKFYLTQGGYLMPRIKDTTDKPEMAFWTDSRYNIENWVFEDITLTNQDINNLIDYNTRVLIYTEGDDIVRIGRDYNLVYLMQGNDTIITEGKHNIIEASSGNDLIYNKAQYSNDEIYMSVGTDYTEDWGGNDRYIYNKGDGHDIIVDMGGNDTVKFNRWITQNDLIFNKSGDDLVVTFKYGSYDSLTIKDWRVSSNYKIETFELWDKSQITSQQVDQIIGGTTPPPPPPPPPATGSDLEIWASMGFVPTITGTDGYDYPRGNYGNDVYYLKGYSDRVMDYAGNDAYLFSKDDGQDNITDQSGTDSIVFGQGISKSGVTFKVDPNNSENLIISINNSSDSINVNKWFRSSGYEIEKIRFADGSYFTNSEINQIVGGGTTPPPPPPPPTTGTDLETWASMGFVPTIVGTDGYDYPRGNYGNDVYYLKGYSDRVMDYAGNDAYLFSKGDWQDNITDAGGSDSIVFGQDISKNGVTFKVDPNNSENLIISINNSNDSINVNKWFRSSTYEIEKVRFADGTYFTNNEINQIVQQISAYSTSNEPEIMTTVNNEQDTTLVINSM